MASLVSERRMGVMWMLSLATVAGSAACANGGKVASLHRFQRRLQRPPRCARCAENVTGFPRERTFRPDSSGNDMSSIRRASREEPGRTWKEHISREKGALAAKNSVSPSDE
jgi:ribosomal protein L34E